MSENGNPESTPLRQRFLSLFEAFAWTLTLVVLLQFMAWHQSALAHTFSQRAMALLKIGGAATVEFGLIVFLVLRFRRRGIPRFENPLSSQGRRAGWLAAACLWLVFVVPMLMPGQAGPPILEPSGFNLAGSLLAGPGAGVAEELIFRGLLMSLLAVGGWKCGARVVLTSLLFGLSHAGWAVMSGNVVIGLMAMTGTSILGLVIGGIYLLSGRQLLPALAFHAGINLLIEPWLVLGTIQGPGVG